MHDLLQDLRYAIRTLARMPGFAAVAVLSIALGIGANTAIFSLVYAVLLKPLPFGEPGRLIAAWDTYLPLFPKLGISPPELDALQRQSDLWEATAWYRYVPVDLNLIAPGVPAVELHATLISPTLMPLLKVAPALGRGFADAESPQSVLLSDRLWRSRFGGNPAILGQAIRLGDQAYTVAGVMPSGFDFPPATDVWLPPGPLMGDELTNPVRHPFGFVARLRPGIAGEFATIRAESAIRALAAEHPKTSKGFGIQLAGLQEDLTAASRPALLMLWGAVTLVLLIACGNVANLLLSRGAGRTKELAIRTALGANGGRLVRQLLTESLLLAALGGGLGLALAAWSLAVLSPVKASIDAAVLCFVTVISLATGVLFGLAPALQARAVDSMPAIRGGAAGHRRSLPGRGAMVVMEFGLTVMVVIGAGLLVKSFVSLMQVDPGFTTHGVLTLRISSPTSANPGALFHRIDERLRRLPGVDSVASANALPLIASRAAALRFSVPGSPLFNPDVLPVAQARFVSPQYFQAMRIPLRSGRVFTERDLDQPVVVVSESLARRFWPGENAVGKRFVTGPWGPTPTWSTIVGVVHDVKQFGLDSEATMDLYFPSLGVKYLLVRTVSDPSSLAGAVRRELQASMPDAAVSDVRTMDQIVEESAASRRWTAGLLSAFAGVALTLALVGIYGVMSWTVSRRTREIGIRMALGAERAQVLRMVVWDGTRLCGTGMAIGLAAAFVLRRVLASLVFDTSTTDPWIYGGAVLLLLTTASLACYLPARRASRVAPLEALRLE